MRDIGAFDLVSPGLPIDRATDEELDEARDRMRPLVDFLPAAAKVIEEMFGRDFGGLGFFAVLSQRTTAFLRALFVRAGVLLPQVTEENAFADVAAPLSATSPAFRAMLQLMGAFSGYRKYLTPSGVKQLDTLPPEEKRYFQTTLAQYLADHPDIARALNVTAN